MNSNLADIEKLFATVGLDARGAFHPDCDDRVPPLATGEKVRTLVLAGNAGPRMWRCFADARRNGTLTLDAWSEKVLRELAAKLRAGTAFPFERPYLPFQRWAMRAQACHPSPLGLLVHPDYGLWHGFRGALLFAEKLEIPPHDRRSSPCAACAERPCLAACPVGAFTAAGYDVPACARYLASAQQPDCMQIGCRARHACPVGRDYRYAPEQAQFHMLSFLRNHRAEASSSPATPA